MGFSPFSSTLLPLDLEALRGAVWSLYVVLKIWSNWRIDNLMKLYSDFCQTAIIILNQKWILRGAKRAFSFLQAFLFCNF